MTDRIRFHLDEHIDPDVARALRRYGIDVTTTVEAGLRTQSDVAQLEFAIRERRVLVTHDADFLRLAERVSQHAGIAYSTRTARSLGEMIRSLILIYEILAPEEMTGRVEYL
jgi:predicted nuclease of predicted toxin-antitoxin system